MRKMTPRDGCLVTGQRMSGDHITVGAVLRNGEIVPKIGLTPRQMKAGCGIRMSKTGTIFDR